MIGKKNLRKGIKNKIFGCFFAILLMLSSLFGILPGTSADVYAEPTEGETSSVSCKDSLGSLGWLVCPTTGKISEAVDFLYDKIEDVLEINPVEAKDGSPVYEIWKYFQGVTNIVFIIFLLVIVFSQITGMGINNYGVKKALPKLIIAAVLVNLSFYICSLAVDVSNIFGGSLRGLLETVESSVGVEAGTVSGASMAEMYTSLASGTAVAIGGAMVAFETGAIWMMIPLALGALVSVVIGIVTIAMRQAVVTLLIMIAPLAMVAYILPNTEQWFKKWKQLLFQMLIFYPAFSLLFGASSLAGWAIIVSSNNGFGVLIGVAVQIFPLFFSWSLMKMSGTLLGTINSKLNALANRPLGGVKGWAGSRAELSRQKHLASPKAYTPSMRLQQFLSDRKIARDEEIKEHAETAKNRGLAYAAMRNYKRNGTPSKEGEEAYEAQARNAEYQRAILTHKNNMNKGMGQLAAVNEKATDEQKARLLELDVANVQAFDTLKMEQARGEKIDYKNAMGFHQRMQDAINAHMDDTVGKTKTDDGKIVNRSDYKRHFDIGSVQEAQARARYDTLSKIMEGDEKDAAYAEAVAAHAYDTQNKIIATKTLKNVELTPPTMDLVYRLDEFTKKKGAAKNVDLIIPSLRALNMRGDTDLVKDQIINMMREDLGGGVEYGSHASQALASFLMFDVKDSDPFLRRFGKYINLETARIYNSNDRKNMQITYDEYIRGYHMERDEDTGQLVKMYAKKGMKELMEGTSLDNVERTAFSSFDESLRSTYCHYIKDNEGNDVRRVDIADYLNKREEVQQAIGPQFISASLKYLSGSEQLVNAVSFLTGYSKKQKVKKVKDKKTGKEKKVVVTDEKGNPVYEWIASWEADGDFADNPEDVRKYFNKKALQYVTDQTPTQIFNMRSDYYIPMLNHLAMAYEESKMEGWTDEQIAEHEEYMKELADIQTRYGDLPLEDAKKQRDMDRKILKDKMAGAQFRQLLDSKGKLNQIYRTRRSGAANSAKDWLRKWLDLDNDVMINLRLEEARKKERAEIDKAKKAKENNQERDTGDTPSDQINRIYSDEDIALYISSIEDLCQSLKSEDRDVFYEESLDYIKKELGAGSYIAKDYEKYGNDDRTADAYMLRDYLIDLLSNPNNYQ